MKQETILEVAFNYAAQRFPNGENKDCGIVAQEQYACRAGFMAGVEWQRNHVWRNVLQSPSDGEMVIAMLEVGPLVCGPNHSDWKQTVDELGIIAWAYFKDLIPTSFDEIIEANKDVLQRLRDKYDEINMCNCGYCSVDKFR